MHFFVKIRRAKLRDAATIYKIGMSTDAFAVSRNIKFFSLGELKEFARKKNCIFLVAEVKNVIVGFIIAFVMSKDWIIIDNFYVLPKFRHHLVGTAIVKEVEKIARKRKVDYISLIVKADHTALRKFLKKKKYEETTRFVWTEKFI